MAVAARSSRFDSASRFADDPVLNVLRLSSKADLMIHTWINTASPGLTVGRASIAGFRVDGNDDHGLTRMESKGWQRRCQSHLEKKSKSKSAFLVSASASAAAAAQSRQQSEEAAVDRCRRARALSKIGAFHFHLVMCQVQPPNLPLLATTSAPKTVCFCFLSSEHLQSTRQSTRQAQS